MLEATVLCPGSISSRVTWSIDSGGTELSVNVGEPRMTPDDLDEEEPPQFQGVGRNGHRGLAASETASGYLFTDNFARTLNCLLRAGLSLTKTWTETCPRPTRNGDRGETRLP